MYMAGLGNTLELAIASIVHIAPYISVKFLVRRWPSVFDFNDAQKLFQQDDASRLHNLAMVQGKYLHLIDNVKLPNSWNE